MAIGGFVGRYGFVTSIVAGASLAAAVASHAQALAQGFNAIVGPLIASSCSSSGPCLQWTNAGAGSGVTGISSKGKGVIGQTSFSSSAASNGQAGLLGQDVSASGSFDAGVEGVSSRGAGVVGMSSSGPGVKTSSIFGYGLDATTQNPSKYTLIARSGVFGRDLSLEGGTLNAGVAGLSYYGTGVNGASSYGTGVVGASVNGAGVSASSKNYVGLLAASAASDGINAATTNESTATNQGRSGVYGHDGSDDGGQLNCGVCGASGYGIGVGGYSTNNAGVNAVGGNEGCFAGCDGYPALSVVGDSNGFLSGPPLLIAGCPASAAVGVCNQDSSVFSVDQSGNIFINGTITTGGPCRLGCVSSKTTSAYSVDSYVPRESMPTMEDFGEAQLVSGRAYIHIDRSLANVIEQRPTYLVFITPEGDANTLFVTQKSTAGFSVIESRNGKDSVAFQYRIVARPYGSTQKRLPMIYHRGTTRNQKLFPGVPATWIKRG